VVEVTNGGTLVLSLVGTNFAGSFVIGDSSELLLTSEGAALGAPIDFAGADTELRIDDIVMPSDVISGFVPGGRWIFLDKTSFASSGTAQVLRGNFLQVVEGAVTDDLELDPSQNYASQTFVLLPHGTGGTLVGIGQVATVASGSKISGTTISSGIIEEIFGSATNETVASGGTAVVFSGGAARGTTLLSGGAEFLYGSDANTTISSGGELRVEAGGTASATIIDSGGRELVISGGTVSRATVNDGGRMTVDAGATTTSVSLVGSDTSGGGGREIVLGTASVTTISASALLVVSSGGIAIDTIVNSRTGPLNGGMVVAAGGQASGTTINSGGVEFIDGGTDSGATASAALRVPRPSPMGSW